MKLRFFLAAMAATFLILNITLDSRADECSVCTFTTQSDSLIGIGGLEFLMQRQPYDASPFNAEVRIGGLYDSRVAATSGVSGNEDSDTALVARLKAGWQAPIEGDFGLRMDYRGNMDFHRDYDEFNTIDQSLSLTPQYWAGQFIFSLPISFGLAFLDSDHDYNRYAVSPSLAYLIPDTRQAVAIYAIGAIMEDKDKDEYLDEDGKTLGGGCAYLYYFENKSRVRLSLDYQHTTYDANVWDYDYGLTGSTDKRENDSIIAGLDMLFQVTDHLGLYINYAFIHADSNVDFYEYDRHLVEGGLVLNF